MNSNRRVLLFVLSSVTLYLLFSFSAYLTGFNWLPFQRVNLVADIIASPPETPKQDSTATHTPSPAPGEGIVDFNLYQQGHRITRFRRDSLQPALPSFVKALHELKRGKKRKIRVAYFGDSMIEGDLMTQTIREMLQKRFGGRGVGFVPVTSIVAQFRQTARATYSNGWDDESFKTRSGGGRLYLSGHLFRGDNEWVEIYDQTTGDSSTVIEKSLLCGQATHNIGLLVNGQPLSVSAPDLLNRVVLARDGNPGIRVQVSQSRLPVYGISFESPSGIIVDNFSFRGITGVELARIDSSFLRAIEEENPYDLIVFQYGVNLLFRPKDRDFSWYGRALRPVLQKFRNCFPETEIVIVSTADRAFRYNGEYRSALGIDSLIKVQAQLAFETGSHFYNQYETMGGPNSIVDWASRQPSLANRDYVHPNHRGAELLGRFFVEAIIREYDKYERTVN